jgi:SAM-dependent methyltransferase
MGQTKASGTSDEVLRYYAKNWTAIAGCYELDDEGLPVDPAWYRRRIYNEFLSKVKPPTVLDIGCGGGWTVLDALARGLDAIGVEPVAELRQAGRALLADRGYDPERIKDGDLANISSFPAASYDCASLLSVLPHVPADTWDEVHRNIVRLLRPGGHFVAAYRNELFDLYTFNSFTMELYDRTLWKGIQADTTSHARLERIKSLVAHPDVPGPYHTNAADATFGQLKREKSNPLTMPGYLRQFGLETERTRFYHFHAVPPLAKDVVKNYRLSNHELDLSLSDDWRGHFMAAMFVVEAVAK